ncbi:A/G-specific adenine glycosylase [candidate division KSB1 bacterium]|nr:A/G-specific adenine glycosylase [candidate division KSB1 bacterium]
MRIHPDTKKAIQFRLLKWFDENKREMPWRETRNPYKIWVSEIMLQQTQVKTVESYYNRFIQAFPTIQSLSMADSGQVMKAWEGLGYYSRARNLHKAAKIIVQCFNAQIPHTLEELLSLPGIGRYTAGAILSIAFDQPAPVLDGNVIRMLSRLFHITDNVDRSSTQKRLWQLTEDMLPKSRIRDFNEAMMELGALVCTPKNPRCEICPVQKHCEATRIGIQQDLPVRTPRNPIPHLDVTAGVIWKADRFLITLRPPKGLLGGLWEFPGGKLEDGESLEECIKREIREELEIKIEVVHPLISVKHAYTHFKITLHVFECRFLSGDIVPHDCDDFRWIRPNELDDFAFPGADRKVIDALKMKEGGVS